MWLKGQRKVLGSWETSGDCKYRYDCNGLYMPDTTCVRVDVDRRMTVMIVSRHTKRGNCERWFSRGISGGGIRGYIDASSDRHLNQAGYTPRRPYATNAYL